MEMIRLSSSSSVMRSGTISPLSFSRVRNSISLSSNGKTAASRSRHSSMSLPVHDLRSVRVGARSARSMGTSCRATSSGVVPIMSRERSLQSSRLLPPYTTKPVRRRLRSRPSRQRSSRTSKRSLLALRPKRAASFPAASSCKSRTGTAEAENLPTVWESAAATGQRGVRRRKFTSSSRVP